MSIDQFIVSLFAQLIAAVLDAFFGVGGILSGSLGSLTSGLDLTGIINGLLGIG